LWWRSSASISKTARPGSMTFSTNPSSRPIGGGGASPRCIFRASSTIVAMLPLPHAMRLSVRPGRLALDLLAVEGAALDHAVGPVLNAQEVQRRIRVVPPGPCCFRVEPQDRAFSHVDALAVQDELAPAPDDDVNLVVLLVPVQEGNPLAGRDDVERHLQARRPQQVAQEQFAFRWPGDIGRLQFELRPLLHRASVETGEVGA